MAGKRASGFAGIGYNKEKVGRELKSLDDLWADDLKGKVVVLSEFRDTVGCILLQQGVDISKPVGKQQFETAVAEVENLVEIGSIDKDHIHTPGIFVDRIIKGAVYEKRIERVTTRPKETKTGEEKASA